MEARVADAQVAQENDARAVEPSSVASEAGQAVLRVFRGSPGSDSRFDDFDVPVESGMVVLDALHWIQGHRAPDLAVRWNCKAAKCGSCSAEVNGLPRLTCKTRLSDFDLDEPITVEPMRAFPLIKDLVTDVSWNYEVNKSIRPFTPPEDVPPERWRWQQEDVDRVQEYRKCIECFLCQDVCHVLRNHETERPFMGPRYLVRAAGLELHPMDKADRREYLKDSGGIGYCNITKCCTEVCPEHIKITDNAIIPLKERVADEYYDPIQWVWRKLRGKPDAGAPGRELPVLASSARADGVESTGQTGATEPTGGAPGASSPTDGSDGADGSTPMPEPAPALPGTPAGARSKPRRASRRSDAGDETPSEG
jgi:succinate dehydrogenase / fumarate reductase iron-sulfur subunit